MTPVAINPLTGRPDALQFTEYIGIQQYNRKGGPWLFGFEELLMHYGLEYGKPFEIDSLRLDATQVKKALALMATKSREAQESNGPPLLLMRAETRDRLVQTNHSDGDTLNFWRILSFQELLQEAEQLTLPQKSLATLQTISNLEGEVGSGIPLRFSFEPYPGAASDAREDYLDIRDYCYACTSTESCIVMQYLREEGFIRVSDESLLGTTICITPRGYLEIDAVRAGRITGPIKAFLVCRFTAELDSIFDACYDKIGSGDDLPCKITRVKDVVHNERIDDKILTLIRDSSVVVVDLTDHNFNVAFEAGFALSLGKPIVWTMQKPEGELRLPFDIQSHNILFYEQDKLSLLLEQLKARLHVAIASLNLQR